MIPSRLFRTSGPIPALFLVMDDLAMETKSPAVPQFVELFKSTPLRMLTLEVHYSGDNWSPGHATLTAYHASSTRKLSIFASVDTWLFLTMS